MSKMNYLTEDTVETLKKNAKQLYKEVVLGKTSIDEFLGGSCTIKQSPFEIEDFVLEMSQPEGKEMLTDAENAQRVYMHMKALTDSQAADERIWMAYCLNNCKEYMRYRWKASNHIDVLNKYTFNYSKNRSLFRNGMARLWWIGRLTYDQNRKDPFELTKFMCKHQDFVDAICGRSIFNNDMVRLATLNALFDILGERKTDNRGIIREIAKYVNLLSGTYLLEMLSYEEIYDRIAFKLKEIIKEQE